MRRIGVLAGGVAAVIAFGAAASTSAASTKLDLTNEKGVTLANGSGLFVGYEEEGCELYNAATLTTNDRSTDKITVGGLRRTNGGCYEGGYGIEPYGASTLRLNNQGVITLKGTTTVKVVFHEAGKTCDYEATKLSGTFGIGGFLYGASVSGKANRNASSTSTCPSQRILSAQVYFLNGNETFLKASLT
ncbi:MAG TPA: hypothetical protein VKG38_09570 [Solirubrobacteraceae bacterium]|nr:hypothetical protein [Solirubrobacteraceae bacterium]